MPQLQNTLHGVAQSRANPLNPLCLLLLLQIVPNVRERLLDVFYGIYK
jgi:hypothetical protein